MNGVGDAHTTLPEGSVRLRDGEALHFGDSGSPQSEQPAYYAWRFSCSERALAAHCEDAPSD